MAELTRKEFYQLAIECREWALDLARHDQHRVVPAQCYAFNRWLQKLKSYERLGDGAGRLTFARPITHWHLMGLAVLVWFLVVLLFGAELRTPTAQRILGIATAGTLLLFYFLPERFYGTTTEMLEGKVLRVVETLEKILQSQKMEFTEAAYFQVKENLQAARQELRQQIHLAH